MIYGILHQGSISLREFIFWLRKQTNSIGMSIIIETWIGSESNVQVLPWTVREYLGDFIERIIVKLK